VIPARQLLDCLGRGPLVRLIRERGLTRSLEDRHLEALAARPLRRRCRHHAAASLAVAIVAIVTLVGRR
jgi:hypothetical protein